MKRCRSGVMVGIPVENEHNRVVRPPRQACHRKGSGANRYNRNDRYNRQQAWDKEKEPRQREESKRGTGPPKGFVQRNSFRSIAESVPFRAWKTNGTE